MMEQFNNLLSKKPGQGTLVFLAGVLVFLCLCSSGLFLLLIRGRSLSAQPAPVKSRTPTRTLTRSPSPTLALTETPTITASSTATASPTLTPTVTLTPTLTATPLPQAVINAIAYLAKQLNLTPDQISLISFSAVDWPDSCLGVSTQGTFCLMVITPGYKVFLQAENKPYELHTNATGLIIREAGNAIPSGNIPLNAGGYHYSSFISNSDSIVAAEKWESGHDAAN